MKSIKTVINAIPEFIQTATRYACLVQLIDDENAVKFCFCSQKKPANWKLEQKSKKKGERKVQLHQITCGGLGAREEGLREARLLRRVMALALASLL